MLISGGWERSCSSCCYAGFSISIKTIGNQTRGSPIQAELGFFLPYLKNGLWVIFNTLKKLDNFFYSLSKYFIYLTEELIINTSPKEIAKFSNTALCVLKTASQLNNPIYLVWGQSQTKTSTHQCLYSAIEYEAIGSEQSLAIFQPPKVNFFQCRFFPPLLLCEARY